MFSFNPIYLGTLLLGGCSNDGSKTPPNPRPTNIDAGRAINPPNPVFDFDQDGYDSEVNDCDDSDRSVHPKAQELCDGKDNDCDGATDEDFYIGEFCEKTRWSCVTRGTWQCHGLNESICNAPEPTWKASEEVCDGTDNDCDGETDEGLDQATQVCSNGEWACLPSDEICDEIDNDCDGETDEFVYEEPLLLIDHDFEHKIWSSDGTRVAVRGCSEADMDLYCLKWSIHVYNMEGDIVNEIEVADDPDNRTPFTQPMTAMYWVPQADQVMLETAESDHEGDFHHLSIVDLASGTIRELVRGANAVWSPDGQRVAYNSWGLVQGAWFTSPRLISVINSDGSSGHAIIGGAHDDVVPEAWSPDGSFLLFSREVDAPSGHVILSRYNLEDGSIQEIFNGDPAGIEIHDIHANTPLNRRLNLKLSPQGDKIAFVASDYSVHVMSVEGIPLLPRVVFGQGYGSMTSNRLSWTSNGNWVLAQTRSGFYFINVSTGEVKTMQGWEVLRSLGDNYPLIDFGELSPITDKAMATGSMDLEGFLHLRFVVFNLPCSLR